MKAKVDQDACIGCGLCVAVCPEVFDMPDDVAEVIANPVPVKSEALCREARDGCPTEAISITEDTAS